MMIIQLTGLSGAGKTTLANNVQQNLRRVGIKAEVIDGDVYRQTICKDLGFSKEDRCENLRRLGFVAKALANNGIVALIAAINPYEEIRAELKRSWVDVQTVWLDCDLETLISRDPKG